MQRFRYLPLAAVTAFCLLAASPRSHAQVSINIGPAPVCPYGYYAVAPYNCAPYGYYGPEWFSGGVFIGAGPWYHGHDHFYGHVNSRYHPDHGYRGPYPNRGETPRAGWNGHAEHFQGNEMRDEHGHVHGEGRH